MTQRLRRQASQFWQVLSGPETRRAYGSAVAKTGAIVREGGLLIWLLVCLVLVAFDSGVAAAIAAGRASRSLVSRLSHTQPDAIAVNTKQSLLSAGQTGLATTLSQARQQLGLPQKPEATPQAAAPNAVPEVTASKTTAPETEAPETEAPETEAPETEAAEAKALEAKALEAKAVPGLKAEPAASPKVMAKPDAAVASEEASNEVTSGKAAVTEETEAAAE